jgi:hypothetical protein
LPADFLMLLHYRTRLIEKAADHNSYSQLKLYP